MSNSSIEVGAYFYPLTTQCDVKRSRALEVGKSMGFPEGLNAVDETLLAQQAVPLFEGHQQPNTYCLDENTSRWDDSDKRSMEAQIGLAQDAGLSFFVFDSYCGVKKGVPTIESERPQEMFRQLTSRDSNGTMKYALMQTLASPRVVLPLLNRPNAKERDRVYDIDRSSARFIVDTCISNWEDPNYFRIGDDRPYMSLFMPDMTVGWSDSQVSLPNFIGEIKEYSQKKYQIEPYVAGSIRSAEQAEEMRSAGADALTGYAFLPVFGDGTPPIQDYGELVDAKRAEWEEISRILNFMPPAVVGWDASPRGKSAHQVGDNRGSSYAPIVTGATPEKFAKMLADTLNHARKSPEKERYGLVCAWNEITEGAALLPKQLKDGTLDTSYMDAARLVIKNQCS